MWLGPLLGAEDRKARPPCDPPSPAPGAALREAPKTDRTDAKGILEAARNSDIHPVPIKTVAQQMLTSLHRMRQGWMADRTAKLNRLRGLLRELGHFIPVGAEKVVPEVWALLEDADSEIPDALRPLFAEAAEEVREIEARIKKVEVQLEALAPQLPAVVFLLSIPGIGLLTATALVAFIGDIRRFPSGRHLASYLGLTPREFSSGSKRYLGRISKRGDGYLRTLLIHGARSLIHHAQARQQDRLRTWAHNLAKTHVHNKAAVAGANKLARIALLPAQARRLRDHANGQRRFENDGHKRSSRPVTA